VSATIGAAVTTGTTIGAAVITRATIGAAVTTRATIGAAVITRATVRAVIGSLVVAGVLRRGHGLVVHAGAPRGRDVRRMSTT
jgi:hypothetical protein